MPANIISKLNKHCADCQCQNCPLMQLCEDFTEDLEYKTIGDTIKRLKSNLKEVEEYICVQMRNIEMDKK